MVDPVPFPSREHGEESQYSEASPVSPPVLSQNFCSACGIPIDARAAICPKCGVPQRNAPGQGHPNAVLALILNIFFPGVGTLVLGETTMGITQLALWLVSIPLSFIIIGIPLFFGVWIWAIVVAAQSLSRPPGNTHVGYK